MKTAINKENFIKFPLGEPSHVSQYQFPKVVLPFLTH